jgi:uncharacterized membrane protein
MAIVIRGYLFLLVGIKYEILTIMKKDGVFLKNYPVSITAYLIYSLLWAKVVYMKYQFSRQAIRSVATGGEAIELATFLITVIGLIIGFVMLILYLRMNTSYNNKFYGVLAVLILVQTFIGCCS